MSVKHHYNTPINNYDKQFTLTAVTYVTCIYKAILMLPLILLLLLLLLLILLLLLLLLILILPLLLILLLLWHFVIILVCLLPLFGWSFRLLYALCTLYCCQDGKNFISIILQRNCLLILIYFLI